jgi:hypothetical protein
VSYTAVAQLGVVGYQPLDALVHLPGDTHASIIRTRHLHLSP